MSSAEVKLGIHRHYKGRLYLVLGIAHDADYEDRTVVVYIGLELDEAHLGPRMAVRSIEEFTARVAAQDSAGNRLRHLVPRFEYLGPELTGDMLVT